MDPQCHCHKLHAPKSAEHRARIAAGVKRYHARARAALATLDNQPQA